MVTLFRGETFYIIYVNYPKWMFKLNKGSDLENKFRNKKKKKKRNKGMEHWMILSQVFIYSVKNGWINQVLEPGNETLGRLNSLLCTSNF